MSVVIVTGGETPETPESPETGTPEAPTLSGTELVELGREMGQLRERVNTAEMETASVRASLTELRELNEAAHSALRASLEALADRLAAMETMETPPDDADAGALAGAETVEPPPSRTTNDASGSANGSANTAPARERGPFLRLLLG